MPNSSLPFVTAICPHYRQPKLLANSLALFLAQTYPAERRQLVILDDSDTYYNHSSEGFMLWSESERIQPSLYAKYNKLLTLMPEQTEIVLVWETNGLYLPGYIWEHVHALTQDLVKQTFPYMTQGSPRFVNEFSKPSHVLSDYHWPDHKRLVVEKAAGRFHSSMAFTKDLITRIGGWPKTKRADFDQQLISVLTKEAKGFAQHNKERKELLNYGYSWHTGYAHCQSTMRDPADETWYERGEQAYAPVPFVGRLEPQYDERTIRYHWHLGIPVNNFHSASL